MESSISFAMVLVMSQRAFIKFQSQGPPQPRYQSAQHRACRSAPHALLMQKTRVVGGMEDNFARRLSEKVVVTYRSTAAWLKVYELVTNQF
eukprot:scaffold1474_cov19-Tisochrysis_lutea.AAC.3